MKHDVFDFTAPGLKPFEISISILKTSIALQFKQKQVLRLQKFF